ncbi:MAG: hypothetical protein ACP5IE_00125 [Infirmifilum sp.]
MHADSEGKSLQGGKNSEDGGGQRGLWWERVRGGRGGAGESFEFTGGRPTAVEKGAKERILLIIRHGVIFAISDKASTQELEKRLAELGVKLRLVSSSPCG